MTLFILLEARRQRTKICGRILIGIPHQMPSYPNWPGDRIDEERNLYISTDEPDASFFDPLKDKYTTHFLDEYKDLWDTDSEWYSETAKINGSPVEFDGYMRISVDTEVFLRGKKQIETFNELTNDCKDGVNTCSTR